MCVCVHFEYVGITFIRYMCVRVFHIFMKYVFFVYELLNLRFHDPANDLNMRMIQTSRLLECC